MQTKTFDFNPDKKALDSIEEIKKEAKDLVDKYIEIDDLDEIISYSYKQGYEEAVSEFKEFLESLGMSVIDD